MKPSQHTPTPWKSSVWTYEGGERKEIMIQNDKDAVCKINGLYRPDSDSQLEEKANAAFIVKAVNAHDDLLAFVRIALPVLQLLDKEKESTGIDMPLVELGKIAIIKAEGEL